MVSNLENAPQQGTAGGLRIFSPRLHAARLLQGIPPRWLAVTAALLFAVFSGLAYWQFTRPFRPHQPYARFGAAWWLHPAEWNLEAGLPEINGNINAIAVVPGSNRLWIAGDAGLLAYSDDQGVTWTLLHFDVASQEFLVDSPASAALPTAAWHWPTLLPTVHAAAPENLFAPEKKPPDKQPQQQNQNSLNQAANAGPEQMGGKPSGAIIASPNPVEFGKVVIGKRATQTVDITNATGQPVKISLGPTRDVGWGEFSIANNGCNGGLNVGQHCKVTLDFSPRSAQAFTAHLRGNGDLAASQFVLTIQGAGIPPVQSTQTDTSNANHSSITATIRFTTPPDLTAFTTSSGLRVLAGSKLYFLSDSSGKQWKADPETTITRSARIEFAGAPLTSDQRFGQTPLETGDLNLDRFKLKAITASDAQFTQAWLAGATGVILRTNDKGKHWLPVTRTAVGRELPDPYQRFLPPWYWLALALCGFVLSPLLAPSGPDATKEEEFQELPFEQAQNKAAVKRKGESSSSISEAAVSDTPAEPKPTASGIGNQAISDRPLEPGEPDALGLGAIAAGLAFFLRNDKTRPPLVLGINGRWGSGKSSLMNLLKKELADSGSQPVWFNAWHHQKESQLLAALLQAIKDQAVPRLSTWNGCLFRIRLLWVRLQKYWLRIAALLGVLYLMLQVERYLQHSLQTTFGSVLTKLFSGSDGLFSLVKNKPILTLLAGLLAAFKALSNGLTAFGTNPASLLTTISGGSKRKDLDAQTSFRQRFSAEFGEVTEALGPHRRMLILIDDLDRCRPEKVREVLEAVNFLVSSGDCFIVLGMARDIVEHCVGLSFSRIVDTMGWDAMGLSDEEIRQVFEELETEAEKAARLRQENAPAQAANGDELVALEQAAKRRAFARLYLDKLVQIEVAVPEPTAAQRRLLFQTDEEQARKSAAEVRVAKTLKAFSIAARWLVPTMQAALVVLAVTLTGLAVGQYIKPLAQELFSSASAPTASPSPTPAQEQAATQNTATNAAANTATPESQPTPTPATRQTSTAPTQTTPVYQPGEAAVHVTPVIFWPLFLAAMLAIIAISNAMGKVAPRKVTDTQVFVNALKIWQRLVMTSGARNTPRTARRFQNRVRYLAMRQRALSQGPAQPQLERWLRLRWQVEKKGAPPVMLPESEFTVRDIEDKATQLKNFMEQDASGDVKDWTSQEAAASLDKIADPFPKEYLLNFLRGNIYIPEPILVGLAAIEEYEPSWIQDEDLFSKTVQKANEVKDASRPTPAAVNSQSAGQDDAARYSTLQTVVAEHLKTWNSWSNVRHFRRAYLLLGSEAHWQGKPTRNLLAAAAGQKS